MRTLWAARSLTAGTVNASWDGLDDFGKPVPADTYSWKVIYNGSVYTNISVIGNTGLPANTFGHVPFYLEGVAIDSQTFIYTVQNWDEPHQDIKKWDPQTGQTVMHSGHPVPNQLLISVALEPDGSVAYVTGFDFPKVDGNTAFQNRLLARFCIWKISMAPGLSEGDRRLSFTDSSLPQVSAWDSSMANKFIAVYKGTTGYPSAGYPTPAFPSGASAADIDVMGTPLHSIAVSGGSIYVTDALGGRILKYHKVTGTYQQTINNVPLARGLVVAPDGKIWVGSQHTNVRVYDASGNLLATPITNLAEVAALSLQGNTLCVADETGQIRQYTVNGTQLTQVGSTFGQPQRAGDWQPNKMYEIHGMALDSAGNIVVTDRVGHGSRMQKFSSTVTQLWQQLSLEFSSSATYVKENPNVLISASRQFYQADRTTGSWSWLGRGYPETSQLYFGQYEASHDGPGRALRLNGNDFYYFAAGDSMAVYRILPAVSPSGPTLKLVSVLGGSQPSPDGVHRDETWRPENRYLWEWNDLNNDGVIQYAPRATPGLAGEVTLLGLPGLPDPYWQWVHNAFEVDDTGWIWFASTARDHIPDPNFAYEGQALYATPPQSNSFGNTVYSWRSAVKVMDEITGVNALGGASCEYKMANRDNSGMVYALATSNRPGLAQDGGAWMGGNVLFGFQETNTAAPAPLALKWYSPLPNVSVGLAPIRGGAGGVLVGNKLDRGTIGHYNKEGLLIGTFKNAPMFGIGPGELGYEDQPPGNWPSGGLDSFLAINCQRNPVDGLLDVFVEDNLNLRVYWYRVDDSNIQVVGSGNLSATGPTGSTSLLTVNGGTGAGNYTSGVTINIVAGAPPQNKVFAYWTGDTSGVANVNSGTTTVTMSGSAKTLTPAYRWVSGPDKIRFFPAPGQTQQILTNVWEGTNGDPVNGPYEIFYQPDQVTGQVPQPGWNDINVNTKGFRYLRWRQKSGNGLINELEWYRNGVKQTGAFFGSPGSWQNNLNQKYPAALDGDTSTGFNGPDINSAGWVAPHIGVDTTNGTQMPTHVLTVNKGSGAGNYSAGKIVTVSANASPAGKQFDRWMDDWVILSNPFIATTTATMPDQDVAITAAYSDLPMYTDKIRYYPRAGFTDRMVGGVFEGTNGDRAGGPVHDDLHNYEQSAQRRVGGKCECGELPLLALSRAEWLLRKCLGDRVLPQRREIDGNQLRDARFLEQ